MHARLVTFRVADGRMDEAIAVYRDSVVPEARKQKGFESALLLTDRATGRGASVVFWKTESDMVRSRTSGYLNDQVAKFATLFDEPPFVWHYDVSVQV